ncbi:NmrA family transcriptional regulator [Knoellia locipacati]|uniref:NmrA family transcriptional regulator n=1 Tax=Knoellia locipacati TaxID=882824 RepID=UPI00384FD56F
MTTTNLTRDLQPATVPATSSAPVAIVGGLGKTGARVAARLREHGIPTRPVSRSTTPRFDWDDATTWRAALQGARAAYVAYQPDLAVPGADAQIHDLATLATEIGVERFVLLSGRGEDGALASERAALAAHPHATVCRCSWFAQNFTEGMFADALTTGTFGMPVPGDVPEPFVDLDDVADVAVAALTQEGHAGIVHELTGPASITLTGAAEIVAAASGLPFKFVRVTPEEFIAAAVDGGLDAPAAAFLAGLFEELLDGRGVIPTTGVRDALGREPKAFEDWAEDALSPIRGGGVR